MPAPLLLDVSHTAHSAARTGIQRVVRGLHAAFGAQAAPVTFDPWAKAWRGLQSWELANLTSPRLSSGRRGTVWPAWSRAAGRVRRWRRQLAAAHQSVPAVFAGGHSAAGLIVPEVFTATVGAALPALFAQTRGPKIALFHDGIALRLPEFSPAGTVARFPAYLAELSRFDGVAAVSAASRDELMAYWEWAGLRRPPPVVAVPLGVAPPKTVAPPASAPGDARLEVLCVGTIEGRKNQSSLVAACEELWTEGLRFRLRLIGHAQRETGAEALACIAAAAERSDGRVVYHGPAGDNELESAYANAAFTVYPSLAEGFGLPVAESLVRGKPCICAGTGALGEIAAGGGCLTVAAPTAGNLREAIRRLLVDAELRGSLAEAARRRQFRTPADHARDLTDWMSEVEAVSRRFLTD